MSMIIDFVGYFFSKYCLLRVHTKKRRADQESTV
jgi:hypothetical protein